MSEEEKYDSSRSDKEKIKTRTIVVPKVKKVLKPKTTTKETNIRKREFKPKKIENKFYVELSDYTVKEQIKKGTLYIISDKLNEKTLFAKVFTYSDKNARHHIGVYTAKTDVYSFGILMFEVLAGRRVYENDKLTPTKLASKVLNEKYRPKFDFEIKEGLKKIIEACWTDDPKERPSFEEIFNKSP